jgi:hypothetical protein
MEARDRDLILNLRSNYYSKLTRPFGNASMITGLRVGQLGISYLPRRSLLPDRNHPLIDYLLQLPSYSIASIHIAKIDSAMYLTH